MTIGLDRNGGVTRVESEGAFPTAEVRGCVEGAIRATTFPPSQGVTASFLFNVAGESEH